MLLANNNESLGKLVGTYLAGSLGVFYLVLGFGVLGFSLICFSFAATHSLHELVNGIWVLAFICAVLGIFILFRWWKYRNSRIYICENGLGIVLYGRTNIYQWDDVDFVIKRGQIYFLEM